MTGKPDKAMRQVDMELLLRRQATAAETRRYLQGLPQFRADHDLPETLNNLLGQLRLAEQRAGRS